MERLEDEIRAGESPADLALLLRGGEDTREKLLHRARLLQDRFNYAGRPARGISLFAVKGDLDTRIILSTKFRRFATYHRVEAAPLAELGLLLPTFTTPHWSLMFMAPDGAETDEEDFLTRLLAILGAALENPRYEPSRRSRER